MDGHPHKLGVNQHRPIFHMSLLNQGETQPQQHPSTNNTACYLGLSYVTRIIKFG